jgi:hypothetical protein
LNYLIKKIFDEATTIAIYGASSNQHKDSYKVMKFLQKQGYKVLPINPYIKDEFILDEKVFANLKDIKINIDILNVFRPSSEVAHIIKQAIHKNIRTIWLQLDIFCYDCEKIFNKRNLNLIQNKCTKIEHERIFNN